MATMDEDKAALDALHQQFMAGIKAYRSAHGQFYPGLLDGPRVFPRNELVESCRVVSERTNIMANLPKGGKYAEVGTLRGDFVVKVLDLLQPDEVHLFDRSFNPIRPENRTRLDAFGKVTYHTGDSSTLLSKIEAGTFDVVYIDGDHSFRGVWKDLVEGLRVLKPAGYLVCNDYTVWDALGSRPYGVLPAVNKFANENKLTFEFIALNSWGNHDVALRRAAARRPG